MKKCEKCGNLIYPDAEECPFCNAPQQTKKQEEKKVKKQPADFARNQGDWMNAEQSEYAYDYDAEEDSEQYKKRDWKRIFTIFISAVLIVALLVTGWFILQKVTSPAYTTKALEKAVNNSDAAKLTDLIVFSGKDQTFTENEAESLIDYYHENREAMVSLVSHIKNGNQAALEDRYLTLEKHGKKWLFFPDYHFVLSPASVSVTANLPNVDLYVDDKKVNTLKDKKDYVLKGLIPGKHTLTGSYNQKGTPHVSDVKINTYSMEDGETVKMSFKGLSPDVTEDYLKKTLEEDLGAAVAEHANQWVKAQKNQDTEVFTRIQNEDYIDSAKESLSLLQANNLQFKGDVAKVAIDRDSIAFSKEGEDKFQASVDAALTFDKAYYSANRDPENVETESREEDWKYQFTYDHDKEKWMITGSQSLDEINESNLAVVAGNE